MRITHKNNIMIRTLLALSLISLMIPALFSADVFKVIETSGKVEYRAPNSFKKVMIKNADELLMGGRIKMSAGSTLKLKSPKDDIINFKDKSYIKLSKLVVKGPEQSLKIDLFQGKVHCNVKKLKGNSDFIIKTPSAVAGVRGTSFACLVAPSGTTDIIVVDGAVAVQDVEGNFAPTVLGAGRAARMKSGSKMRVKRVSTSKKAKAKVKKTSAKVEKKETKKSGETAKPASTDKPIAGDGEKASATNSEGETNTNTDGENSENEGTADTDSEETGSEEDTDLDTSGDDLDADATFEAFADAAETEFDLDEVDTAEFIEILSDEIANLSDEIIDEILLEIEAIENELLFDNIDFDIEFEIGSVERR
jgi:hypothetical protein